MVEAGAEDPGLLAELPSEGLRAQARAMLNPSASRGQLQPQGTLGVDVTEAGSATFREQPLVASCRCGCGEQVGRRSNYRPGHDARHASQIGRAMIAAGAEDPVLLAELPSEALREKARAMLVNRSPTRGLLQPDSTSVRRSSQERPAVESEALPVPPGDSSEQRGAEAVMLAALGERLGVALSPTRLHLLDGSVVEVDGVGSDPAVLVEAWAHQGPTKPAQRNKVLADAFKLVYVASQLQVAHRKVLCLSDDEAARPFLGRSWYAEALRSMEVTVEVVPLGEEWRERVLKAQARQYR
ncbi:hypothetical protein [Modestobacter sp. SYSU DS0511]